MTTCGTVISVEKNGLATVRVPRESSCGKSCASCGSCEARAIVIKARNRAGASRGSIVVIESSSAETLKLSFITYLLPLILFFACWLIHPAAAAASVLVSGGIIFLTNRRLKKESYRAEIVRILEDV